MVDKVDILVNAAAIWHNESEVFAEKEYFEFDWNTIYTTMQVGIIAPMMLIFGLKNKFQKGANIINISGTFENGGKGWVPYYVSKRALEELTLGLADDLKERGIMVNAVSPSDTATLPYSKFFPQFMNVAVKPSEVAEMVVKIINEKRSGDIEIVKFK